MFRTTPLPSAGLRRAYQVRTDDVVQDTDGQMWRVHSVHVDDDLVTFTLRNVLGEKALRGMPASTWVTLAERPETAAEFRGRVIERAMPWWIAGVLVALVAAIAEAPTFGGQWLLIFGFWTVGCVRMATTPEQTR
jgi:hypothetical protein